MKVLIEYDSNRDVYNVFIYERCQYGMLNYRVDPDGYLQSKEHQPYEIKEPALVIDSRTAKLHLFPALITAFEELGLDVSRRFSKDEKEAMSRHLEDMRRISFHFIGGSIREGDE